MHAFLRETTRSAFQRAENVFDEFFGAGDNPLRHLGALGLYLLWILVGTGLYLYIVLDTSIEGVYRSIGDLSIDPWSFGAVFRSFHRYGSDAFFLAMGLHLVREWAFGRYYGFRLYSWLTGIPLIWFAFVSGIGGYWIVWDSLAQFSATATTELLDVLPIFSEPAARNFLAPHSVNDRLFTVLVFIHIGVPLMMILGLWAHVNRISHVDYLPSRNLMLGTLLSLVALALIKPALSDAPANLASLVAEVRMDWIILFIHPLTDLIGPWPVWGLIIGGTFLLFALPAFPISPRAPVAVVDPPNCTGCRRCYVDCPYAAIEMAPHPDRRGQQIAIVDVDLCASCGLCAGSCPSSTPFRSQEILVSGIDMPQMSMHGLRRQLEERVSALQGDIKVVVFACAHGVKANPINLADTTILPILCAGMLPPSFVEYALRSGADGVMVAGCRDGGCDFRLGMEWTRQRLLRVREPHLREVVPAERLSVVALSAWQDELLHKELARFRAELSANINNIDKPQAFSRRVIHHA